jgi:hypothetical protein
MPHMPWIDTTGWPMWAKALYAGVCLAFAACMLAGALHLRFRKFK